MAKKIYSVFVVLKAMVRLAFNPKNIDPLLRLSVFYDSRAAKICLETIRSSPEMQVMLKSRFLSEPFNFKEMLKLPENTLGHQFARFSIKPEIANPMEWRKLDPHPDDDLIYLIRRGRQTHDIHHTVLGFPATPIGEIAILTFMTRQTNSPICAGVVMLGILVAIFRNPSGLYAVFDAIVKGWKAGDHAKMFLSVRWEDYFMDDIQTVRERVGILEVPKLIEVDLFPKKFSKREMTQAEEIKMPEIKNVLQTLTVQPPKPSRATRALIARNAQEDLERALARGRGLRIARSFEETESEPSLKLVSGDHYSVTPYASNGVVVTEPVFVIPPVFRHHAELAKMTEDLEHSEFEF